MAKSSLEVNEQKFLKGISRFISIVATIGRFLLYFAIFAVVVCMLLAPKFLKDIKAYDNKIELSYNKDKISLVKESDDEVRVYVNDKKQSTIKDMEDYDKLYKVVKNHSSKTLTNYSEAVLLIAILYIFIVSMILTHLSKLFKNISKEETPFIMDNVIHLRKMSLYMIVTLVLPIIISLVFALCTGYKLHITLNISGIVEALFVMAMSIIFRYGCVLQNKSTNTIYDNE